ncbi:nucleotidyltransferase domain-containing protein [Selenomonas sputigena]|uniref:nucleotidyltransferase domain-containing protein n=1 Tax=Selenomonas sputigena TaxID=69823 RepID=UPI00222EAF71|nr:nucleotidyltransferase domain-containing protein [Selenomonas sputigena]UZD44371.1 nucleotidyltransferase domain-containing protein [Selenomonas sputigena]
MNLPNTICEGIVRLARKYGLSRVVLFGSRARGDNWERSDVDLAVAGGDVVRFSLDVDEELPTLLMFDVVNLDGPVQPELLAEIQRDGVLLYEKGREFPQSVGKSQGDRGEEASL